MRRSRSAKCLDPLEDGFSLVEVVVVVLILLTLVGMAIPTYLGTRERGQDRAAQMALRTALMAAKPAFTDREDYADATGGNNKAMKADEPSLIFLDLSSDASTSVTQVSAASSSVNGLERENRLVASVQSASGRCWYLQSIAGPPATQNTGMSWAVDTNGEDCSAADAPPYDSPRWVDDPLDAA